MAILKPQTSQADSLSIGDAGRDSDDDVPGVVFIGIRHFSPAFRLDRGEPQSTISVIALTVFDAKHFFQGVPRESPKDA